jgi:hypothetical protein
VSQLKEGDRVQVVSRPVTEEDRKTNRYFQHMAGLVGTVGNVYDSGEVGVNVDLSAIGSVTKDVHTIATDRMRTKFSENATEEQRKSLTKEEMEFTPHYVLLVNAKDLVKA